MNHNILFACLAVISFSVSVLCSDNELDLDIEKLKAKLPEGVKLPDGIELPDSLKNVTLPSVDEAKKLLKDKCQKVSGGETAYEGVESAANQLKECTSGLIDIEQLQKEIEAAQPTGELDTVFNKYCRKRSIAYDCLNNFTKALDPCLEPKEIDGQKTLVRIITNLLEFVCTKDGDQIALFIAEKGPECFSDKKDGLVNCINSTFSSYIPAEDAISTNGLPAALPQLVMGVEQCNDFDKLQQCVIKELETCEESTPANLVESMFKFVRKETPCVNITAPTQKAQSRKSAANVDSVSTYLVVMVLTVMAAARSLLNTQ